MVARRRQERAHPSGTSEASAEAIAKAESANEKRFESVNEFRAQLTDQTATFMPREVYAAAHEQLVARVAALEKTAQFGEGRQKGVGITTSVLVTVITIALAFLTVVVVVANYISSG
ncbi:MAG: hypothetical protein M3540_13170 [Actinomycetota bacterium]|nr:hypothetical protein [Actinomycetota bacterium]